MRFAASTWLILLLPWALLAAWVLWSNLRSAPARVPFVHLWPRSAAPARAPRRLARPPAGVLALLAALLLAVLGSARPQLPRSSTAARSDWERRSQASPWRRH